MIGKIYNFYLKKSESQLDALEKIGETVKCKKCGNRVWKFWKAEDTPDGDPVPQKYCGPCDAELNK